MKRAKVIGCCPNAATDKRKKNEKKRRRSDIKSPARWIPNRAYQIFLGERVRRAESEAVRVAEPAFEPAAVAEAAEKAEYFAAYL